MAVKLKTVELEFQWPNDLSFLILRKLLIAQLQKYGEPLRWAITDINPSSDTHCFRRVTVEAVLIIS